MSNLQQILNDNEAPDFDLSSIYMPPNQPFPSHPYSSLPAPTLEIYPDLEIQDSIFVQDSNDGSGNDINSFSDFDLNQIADGVNQWAELVGPVDLSTDRSTPSGIESTPVDDGAPSQVEIGGIQASDGDEDMICYGMVSDHSH